MRGRGWGGVNRQCGWSVHIYTQYTTKLNFLRSLSSCQNKFIKYRIVFQLTQVGIPNMYDMCAIHT